MNWVRTTHLPITVGLKDGSTVGSDNIQYKRLNNIKYLNIIEFIRKYK